MSKNAVKNLINSTIRIRKLSESNTELLLRKEIIVKIKKIG